MRFIPTPTSLTGRLAMAAVAVCTLAGLAWQGDRSGAAAAPAARMESVAILAIDYGYEGVPARVPVGTSFTLVNDSEIEVHELVAVRIVDSEKRPAAELINLSEDDLFGVADIEAAMVLIALPRSPGFPVAGDSVLTVPGRYVLACFIPQGVDPQVFLTAVQMASGGPPQLSGGLPHAFLGMVAEVIVE